MTKLNLKILEIKQKLETQVRRIIKKPTLTKFKFSLLIKNKKVLLIVGSLLIVVVVLFIIFQIFMSRSGNNGLIVPPKPTSTSTPPTDIIYNPSPYADDEEVLKIEADLGKLEKDFLNVYFREDILRLPGLDWNVSFRR